MKNDLITFLDPNTDQTSESTKVVLGKSNPTKHSATFLNRYRHLLRPVRSALVSNPLRLSALILTPRTSIVSTATQFVVEEKIMAKYSVTPLYAVGLEGLFGATTIIVLMPVMATWASRSTFFDLPRGWHQMIDTPTVLWSGVVIALSIAFFNFFGLSVTRHVSASSRSLTVRPYSPLSFLPSHPTRILVAR